MVPFPTATTYATQPPSLDWRAPKTPIAIISGTGKFTCFKFGRYIHSMHPTENSLKNFGEKGAWAYPETAQFLGTPYDLSNNKSTNFKFCMHIHRIDRIIGTKIYLKCREK